MHAVHCSLAPVQSALSVTPAPRLRQHGPAPQRCNRRVLDRQSQARTTASGDQALVSTPDTGRTLPTPGTDREPQAVSGCSKTLLVRLWMEHEKCCKFAADAPRRGAGPSRELGKAAGICTNFSCDYQSWRLPLHHLPPPQTPLAPNQLPAPAELSGQIHGDQTLHAVRPRLTHTSPQHHTLPYSLSALESCLL